VDADARGSGAGAGFGVSRVVIGTRAAESEAFVGELVQAFAKKSRWASTPRTAWSRSKAGLIHWHGALDLAKRIGHAWGAHADLY